MNRFSTSRAKQNKLKYELFSILSIRRFVKEVSTRRRFKEFFSVKVKNSLNNQQRKVASSQAQETLVVAGAGTGKTSVLLGRSKYLIEDRLAKPEEIIFLAFNKSIAEEISESSKEMSLGIKGKTFHSFAREILLQYLSSYTESSKHLARNNLRNIAFDNESKLVNFFEKKLNALAKDNDMNLFLNFFSSMMIPYKDHKDFKKIEEYAQYVRSGIPVTLSNERVKSHGEWLIANFLKTHTIDYQYEKVYEKSSRYEEVHVPDFTLNDYLYIEYFGIDSEGNTLPWIDKKKYLKSIEWKRDIHKRNGTSLLELTYQDLKDGILLNKLDNFLQEYKIAKKRISNEEILNLANEVGYTSKFLNLCMKFLGFVRSSEIDIDWLGKSKELTDREYSFLKIFGILYDEYLTFLKESKTTDFTGLILEATKILQANKQFLKLKHILVDEFQDISKDRWNFIEAIRQSDESTIFTFVGDDWQAINEFAGSDPKVMLRLGNWNKTREQIVLNETFRMPQSLCEASGAFVMQNSKQIPKELLAAGETRLHDNSLFFHWDVPVSDTYENIALVISRIGKDARDPSKSLFVLGRYSKSLPNFLRIDAMWAGEVRVSTVHRAKGLEADYVILVDVNSAYPGFPNVMIDDPLLDLVRKKDTSFKHASERRVFYVGITRARFETHVISSILAPSEFALEMQESKLGQHIGFDESRISNCPICLTGYLISNKNLKGLGCSNWPVCSFRTPHCVMCDSPMIPSKNPRLRYQCHNHKELQLMDCPKCKWGVLQERKGLFGSFYGCHLWSSTKCKGRANDKSSNNKSLNNSKKNKPNFNNLSPDEISLDSRVGTKWSYEEELLIFRMYESKSSWEEMEKRTGRKRSAIVGRIVNNLEKSSQRLSEVINKKSVYYENYQRDWTVQEIEHLTAYWKKEISMSQITEKLQKSKYECLHKLVELGEVKIYEDDYAHLANKYSMLEN